MSSAAEKSYISKMNKSRKLTGFYLALLLAVFNTVGVGAAENSHTVLNQDSADSKEYQAGFYGPNLWAFEEILQQIRIPKYSENQFSGTEPILVDYYLPHSFYLAYSCATFAQRDLKLLLSSLIYPTHFFL